MSDAQDWLDDAADVEDCHAVIVAWIATNDEGLPLFESDMRITGKRAAVMFRALARTTEEVEA